MLSANSEWRYELETIFRNILELHIYSSNYNYLIYGKHILNSRKIVEKFIDTDQEALEKFCMKFEQIRKKLKFWIRKIGVKNCK